METVQVDSATQQYLHCSTDTTIVLYAHFRVVNILMKYFDLEKDWCNQIGLVVPMVFSQSAVKSVKHKKAAIVGIVTKHKIYIR